MANEKTTNQNLFFDDQDVVINVNEVYANIISEIDSLRSRFNAIETSLSESITSDKIDNIFVDTDINTPQFQESRLHAFYRMIGFPTVADKDNFYSPGFNPNVNKNKDLLSKNIATASTIVKNKKIKEILTAREYYPKNISKIFTNEDYNSIALALSSILIRPIANQLNKSKQDPLEIDEQKFTVNERKVIFDDFFKDKKDQITIQGLILTRFHILKPFIVDPRIDLTVIPSKNRVCAPFLKNKSQTKIVSGADQIQLKRPYIERVISARFSVKNISKQLNSDYIEFVKNFIKSDTGSKDDELKAVYSDLNNLHRSEINVFYNQIKTIKATVDLLVDSIKNIQKVSKKINWQPIPNSSGPEFGCKNKDVELGDIRNKELEINIESQTKSKILKETEFDIGLSSVNAGDFAFSNIDDIIFGNIKNIGKIFDEQITKIKNSRQEYLNSANNSLRNIEIVMGDFSGLGLIDILAIQATFWTMKPEALVGLIDDDAFERMKSVKELKSVNNRIDVVSSLKEFEKKLSEIYNLIQLFYNFRMGQTNKNP